MDILLSPSVLSCFFFGSCFSSLFCSLFLSLPLPVSLFFSSFYLYNAFAFLSYYIITATL